MCRIGQQKIEWKQMTVPDVIFRGSKIAGEMKK